MIKTRLFLLCALATGALYLPGSAAASDCSTLPTHFTGGEFPAGSFFTNFSNACYTIPFIKGNGAGASGDLNSLYHKLYFKVDPRYQLIVLGAFPQARYFSAALNDEHLAVTQSLLDVNIAPLNSRYVNPFMPGVPYATGQRYALAIDFGGIPGALQKGCRMDGFTVDANRLDATLRHSGMNWNDDSDFFNKYPNAPQHTVDTVAHTNPNNAGAILLRSYLDITPVDPTTNPYVVVRDTASGCALPAAYALNTLQIVTNKSATGDSWMATPQINTHLQYQNDYLPQWCYATDSTNELVWIRNGEYVAYPNPYASYVKAVVPSGLPRTLAVSGQVIRIRFRVAKTPPTPCTGCTRSGLEEIRYASLSFLGTGTLVSIPDRGFVQDNNGYVTLIVTTGATLPAWVAPANGYTVLQLDEIQGYEQLTSLVLRHIVPSASLHCSADTVPYNTLEHTPAGGLMGEYLPVVDYLAATAIPHTASPLVQPDSCSITPPGNPGVWPGCGVF
ncbi:MAG: hypothetical protein U0Q18_02940 [Bryobacteraceae bacterium]